MFALNYYRQPVANFDWSSEPHPRLPDPNYYMNHGAVLHSPDSCSCCWEILQDDSVYHQVPWSCYTWASFSSSSSQFSELFESLLLLKPCGTTHIIQWVEMILFTVLCSKILPPQDRIENTQKATASISPGWTRTAQPWLHSTDILWHGTGNGKDSISGITISCKNWLRCLL